MKPHRKRQAYRPTALVAVAVGLALTVAACGGEEKPAESEKSASSENSAPEKASSEPEATGADGSASPQEELAESKQGDLTLTITSAARGNDGYVTVQGTVTNNGSRLWTAADWMSDERELSKNASSIAGASLVDQKGKKKYLILRDTQGKCLCTQFVGGVRSGQTTDWYAQFPAPPKETTTVTFQVGAMPPAEIPLTEAQ